VSSSPKLHVERHGSGPPLVLAHGFGGSARNFRPQARAFADRLGVVLYDARGHARSEAPEDPAAYDEQELVGDFTRIARESGARVVAGGLSLGAYTALRHALAHPSTVRGLVLAALPSGSDAPGRVDWALGFAETIDREGLERAGERYVWGGAARFDPKGAALIRQGLMEHAPHALSAILRRVLARIPPLEALAPELAQLAIPTLVIVGSEDRESLAPSRRLAELLPEAELVVVPGAGHVVNLVAPAEFNARLTAFLERLPESPAPGS